MKTIKTYLGTNCHRSRLLVSDRARNSNYGLGSIYIHELQDTNDYRIKAEPIEGFEDYLIYEDGNSWSSI